MAFITVTLDNLDFHVSATATGNSYVIEKDHESEMPDWSTLTRYDEIEITTGTYSLGDLVCIHLDNEAIANVKIIDMRDKPQDDNTGEDEEYEDSLAVVQWVYSKADVSDMLQRFWPYFRPQNLQNIINHIFRNAEYVLSDHYQVVTNENLRGPSNVTVNPGTLFRTDLTRYNNMLAGRTMLGGAG